MTAKYSEIWEQNTKWEGGPALLADIIMWLEDRSLRVRRGPVPGNLEVYLLAPNLVPTDTPVTALMPPAQRAIFVQIWQEIIAQHLKALAFDFEAVKGMAMTEQSIAVINAQMRTQERKQRATGARELWQTAAEAFGLDPQALPSALGTKLG